MLLEFKHSHVSLNLHILLLLREIFPHPVGSLDRNHDFHPHHGSLDGKVGLQFPDGVQSLLFTGFVWLDGDVTFLHCLLYDGHWVGSLGLRVDTLVADHSGDIWRIYKSYSDAEDSDL